MPWQLPRRMWIRLPRWFRQRWMSFSVPYSIKVFVTVIWWADLSHFHSSLARVLGVCYCWYVFSVGYFIYLYLLVWKPRWIRQWIEASESGSVSLPPPEDDFWQPVVPQTVRLELPPSSLVTTSMGDNVIRLCTLCVENRCNART